MLVPRVERDRDLLEQSRRTLSSNGFVQHIEVLLTGDLVGLLEPEEAQLTNVNRDGRHLERIVQTAEVDLLTGRQISHFKRAFLDRPPCINAQPVNRPLELGKTGVLQRAVRFADDQQIGFRVLHDAAYLVERGRLALLAGTTALAHAIAAFEVPERAVAAPDDLRQAQDPLVSLQAHHRR